MRDLPFESRAIIQYLVRCDEPRTHEEISKKVKVTYLFSHLLNLVDMGFLKRDKNLYSVTNEVDTLWFVVQLKKKMKG